MRIIADTKQNIKSSRSHTVFRIKIMVEESNSQTERKSIRTSIVNLVDLAGSEGAGKTRSLGLR